jgi:hypothetical protein
VVGLDGGGGFVLAAATSGRLCQVDADLGVCWWFGLAPLDLTYRFGRWPRRGNYLTLLA